MSETSDRIESYAKAFLEVARTEGHLAEVEDELFRFARAYNASDELRLALTDPNLPLARKVAVIQDLLERKALATSQALVLAVVVAGRAGRGLRRGHRAAADLHRASSCPAQVAC